MRGTEDVHFQQRTQSQTVLVTGANGFIGRNLCPALRDAGYQLRCAIRTSTGSDQEIVIRDIGPNTDWSDALRNVEVVIHMAARAHVLKETADDPLAFFRQINTAGTQRLAQMAATSGVRRFIYISSIGVNGEHTSLEHPFTEADPPQPTSAYAVAKWEAEQILWELHKRSALEVVIVRPPLTYGPGVKGNFLRLLGLIRRGLPLPLGGIHNRRSLVAVDNLVDLLRLCISHPQAANECFLVSDGEDLSTTELVKNLAEFMKQRSLLLPIPASLIQALGRSLGRERLVNQLWGSLRIDSSKAQRVLGWTPPLAARTALERTVQWYQVKEDE